MKNLSLIFCFVTVVCTQCLGQNQLAISPNLVPIYSPLDSNIVVKDSTGRQYSYTEWKAMLRSQRFSIRIKKSISSNGTQTAPEYQIVPRSYVKPIRTTLASTPQKPAESEQFHAGDIFKPFKEKAMDGEKLDLKKNAGKVYVINFWFIGCPPCRAEIPDLNALADKYKDNKDVVFVAICLDDADQINLYTKLIPFNYHQIDNGRFLADKYSVHLYPTNVIVNRDGKVAYSAVSNQSANRYWLPKIIDESLAAPVTAPPVIAK